MADIPHACDRAWRPHFAIHTYYGFSKDEAKRLVPNEAAPYVTRSYELRADEGWTFEAIANWLNENAPARLMREKGETVHRPFTARVVQRMIRARVYLGVAHWGAVENPNAHPALVDEAMWNRAQKRVQTYSKKRRARTCRCFTASCDARLPILDEPGDQPEQWVRAALLPLPRAPRQRQVRCAGIHPCRP